MKKYIWGSTAATVMLGAVLLGGSGVLYAMEQSPVKGTLVKKIAQKFNLKEDEVEKVFIEERSVRQQEALRLYEERLAQAVANGKITQEQRQKLLAKYKEMQAKRESRLVGNKSLTREERTKLMKEDRAQLEAWAKANGIDMTYVLWGRGHEGKARRGLQK